MDVIVADNSVFSNFARLKELTSLAKTFGRILICKGVELEIIKGAEKYPFMVDACLELKKGWIEVEKADDVEVLAMIAKLQKEHNKLSLADATIIALAYFKKLPLAIDDTEGIKVGKLYGLKIVTTLDILKMWLDKGLFDKKALNSLLERLEKECKYSKIFRFE